jgi:hypothetical protein
LNFVGIDQTGAVDRLGQPKPLPTCLLEENKLSVFYTQQFSSELLKLNPKLICVDCVIGLPKSINTPLRHAMKLASLQEGYGRAAAQLFFDLLASGKKHNRQVEFDIGANSVFTVHPFQKNIQTGTFRLWKEMALFSGWFYFPAIPGEKKMREKKIPVVEGYPSYYWKTFFKQPHRKPELIIDLLKAHKPKLKITSHDQKWLLKDPNLADAAVLALAAQNHQDEINRKSHAEGWIIGVKSERSSQT